MLRLHLHVFLLLTDLAVFFVLQRLNVDRIQKQRNKNGDSPKFYTNRYRCRGYFHRRKKAKLFCELHFTGNLFDNFFLKNINWHYNPL